MDRIELMLQYKKDTGCKMPDIDGTYATLIECDDKESEEAEYEIPDEIKDYIHWLEDNVSIKI